MADFGTVEGKLKLDASGVKRGVDQATGYLRDYASNVAGISSTTARLIGGAGVVALGAVAAAAGAAAAGVAVLRKRIDELDNINKLSLKTGLATQALTKFGYAASLADLDLTGLAGAMRFLNKAIVEAQDPTSKSAKLFRSLKVDAGAGLEEVLLQTSDAFKKITDSSQRSVTAMALFGRAGVQAIPFLLSDLRGAAAEAQRFGLVVGSATTQAAENVNDNFTRIGKSIEGISTRVAERLLPRLDDASAALVKAFDDEGRAERIATIIVDVADAAGLAAKAILTIADGISRVASVGRGAVEALQLQGQRNAYSKSISDLEKEAAFGNQDAKLILAQRRKRSVSYSEAGVTAPDLSAYTFNTPSGQFVGPEIPGLVPDLGSSGKSDGPTAADIRSSRAAALSSLASAQLSSAESNRAPLLEIERLITAERNAQIEAVRAAAAADKDGVATATEALEIQQIDIGYADKLRILREADRDVQAAAAKIRAETVETTASAEVEIAEQRLSILEAEEGSTESIRAAREALAAARDREAAAQISILQLEVDSLSAIENKTAEQEALIAKLREEIRLRGILAGTQKEGNAAADAAKDRNQASSQINSVIQGILQGTGSAKRALGNLGQAQITGLIEKGVTNLFGTGAASSVPYAAIIAAVIGGITESIKGVNEQRKKAFSQLPGRGIITTGDARDKSIEGAVSGSLGTVLGGGTSESIGKFAADNRETFAGFTLGLSEVLALGVSAPTSEKQIAKQSEKLFRKAGLLDARGTAQTRGPGEITSKGELQLNPRKRLKFTGPFSKNLLRNPFRDTKGRLTGIDRVPERSAELNALQPDIEGLGIALFGDKQRAAQRFSDAFLNTRSQLGLNRAETLRELEKLIDHLQVNLPNALDKLKERFLRGDIASARYKRGIEGVANVLEDKLGPGVDAGVVALSTLNERGVLEVGRFLRAAETAAKGVGEGMSNTLRLALTDGAAVSGEEIGEALSEGIINRATERLLEAPTQKLLSEAASKFDQAVSAKITGDQAGFQRLKAEGLAAFGVGKQSAVEFISSIVPDLRDLITGISGGSRSRGAIGLPSFDTGGIIPGPIGMPRVVVAHGGEGVFTTGQMGEMITLLRQIATANQAKQPIFVETHTHIGAREVQRAMKFAGRVQELDSDIYPSNAGAV